MSCGLEKQWGLVMIHTVKEVKDWTKGTTKIGDTIFKDGTPYISCGICSIPLKQVDAFNGIKHVKVSNGRKIGTIESYKVTVGHWLHDTETIWDEKEKCHIVKHIHTPVIRQVPACFGCWQSQQDARAAKNAKMNDGRNDHLVLYPDKDLPKQEKRALFNGNKLRGTSKKYPY